MQRLVHFLIKKKSSFLQQPAPVVKKLDFSQIELDINNAFDIIYIEILLHCACMVEFRAINLKQKCKILQRQRKILEQQCKNQ
jgi:hypothetical protein